MASSLACSSPCRCTNVGRPSRVPRAPRKKISYASTGRAPPSCSLKVRPLIGLWHNKTIRPLRRELIARGGSGFASCRIAIARWGGSQDGQPRILVPVSVPSAHRSRAWRSAPRGELGR
jgi:hypothetical protein